MPLPSIVVVVAAAVVVVIKKKKKKRLISLALGKRNTEMLKGNFSRVLIVCYGYLFFHLIIMRVSL